jgi:cytochrome c oxidase subunit II
MGTKLIVLVVIVLAAIAVAQLMRLHQLSNKVTGKKEEDVDLKTNNLNAAFMLIFLIVFFLSLAYLTLKYGKGLIPEPASAHGVEVEWLFDVNWFIVYATFLICNFLLFYFSWKYRYHPDRKAYFFTHDSKLELIWTAVPAVTMAVVIILGLRLWASEMSAPSDDAVVVEIYGKQFDWTARYSGDDNKLGYSDYKLVTAYDKNPNALGVVTMKNINWRVLELAGNVDTMRLDLQRDSMGTKTYSAASLYKKEKTMEKLDRIKERVIWMRDIYSGENNVDEIAQDDFVSKELFLVKDQEYFFVFRSQDVIHCAYWPHFRAQMNCVPGQRTTLKFTPIYTTKEMREKTGNDQFNYIMMCNKICGVSHSNMKMPVRVGTQEEFDAWRKLEAGNVTPAVADSEDPEIILDKENDLRWYPVGGHKVPDHHGDGDHEDPHGEEEPHGEAH